MAVGAAAAPAAPALRTAARATAVRPGRSTSGPSMDDRMRGRIRAPRAVDIGRSGAAGHGASCGGCVRAQPAAEPSTRLKGVARETYTSREAAIAPGISCDTLRRWDRTGKIRVERDAGNGRII